MIPETRIESRKLSDLTPADYNPRQISDRALSGLRESVTRFGLVQPIIVNERTGNVVGGHQRRKVLEAEGVDEVDVSVLRWQEVTGQAATLDGDGRTFAEVKGERDAEG